MEARDFCASMAMPNFDILDVLKRRRTMQKKITALFLVMIGATLLIAGGITAWAIEALRTAAHTGIVP